MARKKLGEGALKLLPTKRSGLEDKIATQLDEAGVAYDYEGIKLKFQIPERTATYTPDFPISNTSIVLEGKGYFRKASDRQRMVLVKQQRPDLDIRFVFSDARKPIYKGSKTTYADWCEQHGFPYCSKVIPDEWIKQMKRAASRKPK